MEDSAQEHAAPRGSRPMEQEQPSMSAPADPEDPWASLQSAYRIADGRDPAPVGGNRGGSGKLGAKAPGSQATGSSLAAKGPQQQAEMVVLDDEEDDEFSSAMRTRMKAGVSGAGPGPGGAPRGRPSSNPKQGGWGQGEMAAAGTLMLGAEESFCTPGLVQAVVPVAGYAADQDDDVFGDGPVGCLQARPAAVSARGDII